MSRAQSPRDVVHAMQGFDIDWTMLLLDHIEYWGVRWLDPC